MYFVRTCIIIILDLVFSMEACHKKNLEKVIGVGIYDKLLEILKGSEKIVLAKFYSNVDKKIWKLKDKFNVVTGQTELRLVG